jgi:hypothetical protein
MEARLVAELAREPGWQLKFEMGQFSMSGVSSPRRGRVQGQIETLSRYFPEVPGGRRSRLARFAIGRDSDTVCGRARRAR